MSKKSSPLVAAAMALLLACASASTADPLPNASPGACPVESATLTPTWLWICPQAFCNDDEDCQANCPNDPGASCNLSTSTCSYSSSGGGSGSCQSGSRCTPERFCNDHSDCASCDGGCTGYCASDSVCRVL